MHVDRRKCEGTGFCVAISEELFELDDEHVATVRLAPGDPRLTQLAELAREAEEMCPTGAIAVAELP